MGILSFEKPKKLRESKEHNEMYSSDSGVNGTYVSNMAQEDCEKFKAKHVKGKDERVEIRVEIHYVNVLIKVFKNPKKNSNDNHRMVQMSMNGKLDMEYDDWCNINDAIDEANFLLAENI